MKTLIFSDTHLTKEFEIDKYSILESIIYNSDKVIINGDFWDSWYTSFDDFLKSKWNTLFPLLREKNAVYIHGNHDQSFKCDDRKYRFCVFAGESYDTEIDGIKFHIEHGHHILRNRVPKLIDWYHEILHYLDRTFLRDILHYSLRFFENLMFKFFGFEKATNTKLADLQNKVLKKNHTFVGWLVCGDTHNNEIDIDKKFANSGCIYHGGVSYITVEDGRIELRQSKY